MWRNSKIYEIEIMDKNNMFKLVNKYIINKIKIPKDLNTLNQLMPKKQYSTD